MCMSIKVQLLGHNNRCSYLKKNRVMSKFLSGDMSDCTWFPT